MRVLPALALALAACASPPAPPGDQLPAAANVTIIAHQDDDLIFMQPDVTDVVEARAGLLNVYVTAGNGDVPRRRPSGFEQSDDDGVAIAGRRDFGLMKAYAQAAGLKPVWDCGEIEIHGHTATHCRLDDAGVSLVFLAYPDGGKYGEEPNSLLHVFEGTSPGADTVADHPTHYDQAELIATLAEIIQTSDPADIRTLDFTSAHGRDHADHLAVGALALLATAAAGSHATLTAHRGYSVEDEQPTTNDGLFARSQNLVAHYEACADACAPCGIACKKINAAHDTWLHRRYAIGTRKIAAGALRAGGSCVGLAPDGTPLVAACPAQPTRWELAADGTLRANGRCMGVLPTGEIYTSETCTADRQRRWFYDDEGHLWIGFPPAAQAGMDAAHLWCLDVAGGRPRADLCGADNAPRWELSEPAVTSSLPFPSAPARAVRIADLTGDGKGDLCTVTAGELRCAPGRGDGTFEPSIDLAALAVEPESLALGDVDGDGRADACGRNESGITCALSAQSYSVHVLGAAFARAGGPDATDRSLAITGREVCGLGAQGMQCGENLVSSWPQPGAAAFPADLDGDGRPDWCVATGDGAACGIDRDRGITSDGALWRFSQAGVADAPPTDTATSALADIDGDFRADLCTISDRAITCARSSGNGFGPRFPLATLPPGGALTALWLGDLDGDGTADACAGDGASITCVPSL